MWKPPVRAVVVGLVSLAIAVGSALGWARHNARDIPLSPLHGESRIDPTWPERTGVRGERVAGEMESLDEYARPGFDPTVVHPDVRALYERTEAFEMAVTATWQFPYSLGARVASRWTSRIEQLNLPGPGEGPKRVSSDLFALAEPAASNDQRDDPRVWIRTDDDTGEAVFVAIYASYVEDDERFVNIAVPLPGANLATILRMEHYRNGVSLTTDCPNGGLYLHTNVGAFRLPASQEFRVSSVQESTRSIDGAAQTDADILADQRISLFGVPLVTIRYAATRTRTD